MLAGGVLLAWFGKVGGGEVGVRTGDYGACGKVTACAASEY